MIDSLNDLKQLVVQAAAEKKAFDILVMDLRERSDLTDFFCHLQRNFKNASSGDYRFYSGSSLRIIP